MVEFSSAVNGGGYADRTKARVFVCDLQPDPKYGLVVPVRSNLQIHNGTMRPMEVLLERTLQRDETVPATRAAAMRRGTLAGAESAAAAPFTGVEYNASGNAVSVLKKGSKYRERYLVPKYSRQPVPLAFCGTGRFYLRQLGENEWSENDDGTPQGMLLEPMQKMWQPNADVSETIEKSTDESVLFLNNDVDGQPIRLRSKYLPHVSFGHVSKQVAATVLPPAKVGQATMKRSEMRKGSDQGPMKRLLGAWYGVKGKPVGLKGKGSDVMPQLLAQVRANGRIDVIVGNAAFGDPAVGHQKELVLKFVPFADGMVAGETTERRCAERSRFQLERVMDVDSADSNAKAPEVHILSAWWGQAAGVPLGGKPKGVDVTNKLRQQVKAGGRLDIVVDDKLFGLTDLPHSKKLILQYEDGGVGTKIIIKNYDELHLTRVAGLHSIKSAASGGADEESEEPVLCQGALKALGVEVQFKGRAARRGAYFQFDRALADHTFGCQQSTDEFRSRTASEMTRMKKQFQKKKSDDEGQSVMGSVFFGGGGDSSNQNKYKEEGFNWDNQVVRMRCLRTGRVGPVRLYRNDGTEKKKARSSMASLGVGQSSGRTIQGGMAYGTWEPKNGDKYHNSNEEKRWAGYFQPGDVMSFEATLIDMEFKVMPQLIIENGLPCAFEYMAVQQGDELDDLGGEDPSKPQHAIAQSLEEDDDEASEAKEAEELKMATSHVPTRSMSTEQYIKAHGVELELQKRFRCCSDVNRRRAIVRSGMAEHMSGLDMDESCFIKVRLFGRRARLQRDASAKAKSAASKVLSTTIDFDPADDADVVHAHRWSQDPSMSKNAVAYSTNEGEHAADGSQSTDSPKDIQTHFTDGDDDSWSAHLEIPLGLGLDDPRKFRWNPARTDKGKPRYRPVDDEHRPCIFAFDSEGKRLFTQAVTAEASSSHDDTHGGNAWAGGHQHAQNTAAAKAEKLAYAQASKGAKHEHSASPAVLVARDWVGRTPVLTVFSPLWIMNKSGLPLRYQLSSEAGRLQYALGGEDGAKVEIEQRTSSAYLGDLPLLLFPDPKNGDVAVRVKPVTTAPAAAGQALPSGHSDDPTNSRAGGVVQRQRDGMYSGAAADWNTVACKQWEGGSGGVKKGAAGKGGKPGAANGHEDVGQAVGQSIVSLRPGRQYGWTNALSLPVKNSKCVPLLIEDHNGEQIALVATVARMGPKMILDPHHKSGRKNRVESTLVTIYPRVLIANQLSSSLQVLTHKTHDPADKKESGRMDAMHLDAYSMPLMVAPKGAALMHRLPEKLERSSVQIRLGSHSEAYRYVRFTATKLRSNEHRKKFKKNVKKLLLAGRLRKMMKSDADVSGPPITTAAAAAPKPAFRPSIDDEGVSEDHVHLADICFFNDGKQLDHWDWQDELPAAGGAAKASSADPHAQFIVCFGESFPRKRVTHYHWKTHEEEGMDRADPVRWKLEGSNDLQTWSMLHDCTAKDHLPPTKRNEFVNPKTITVVESSSSAEVGAPLQRPSLAAAGGDEDEDEDEDADEDEHPGFEVCEWANTWSQPVMMLPDKKKGDEERSYIWCEDVLARKRVLVCVFITGAAPSMKQSADVPTICIRIEDCTHAPPYIVSNRSHTHRMWFCQTGMDANHRLEHVDGRAEHEKKGKKAAKAGAVGAPQYSEGGKGDDTVGHYRTYLPPMQWAAYAWQDRDGPLEKRQLETGIVRTPAAAAAGSRDPALTPETLNKLVAHELSEVLYEGAVGGATMANKRLQDVGLLRRMIEIERMLGAEGGGSQEEFVYVMVMEVQRAAYAGVPRQQSSAAAATDFAQQRYKGRGSVANRASITGGKNMLSSTSGTGMLKTSSGYFTASSGSVAARDSSSRRGDDGEFAPGIEVMYAAAHLRHDDPSPLCNADVYREQHGTTKSTVNHDHSIHSGRGSYEWEAVESEVPGVDFTKTPSVVLPMSSTSHCRWSWAGEDWEVQQVGFHVGSQSRASGVDLGAGMSGGADISDAVAVSSSVEGGGWEYADKWHAVAGKWNSKPPSHAGESSIRRRLWVRKARCQMKVGWDNKLDHLHKAHHEWAEDAEEWTREQRRAASQWSTPPVKYEMSTLGDLAPLTRIDPDDPTAHTLLRSQIYVAGRSRVLSFSDSNCVPFGGTNGLALARQRGYEDAGAGGAGKSMHVIPATVDVMLKGFCFNLVGFKTKEMPRKPMEVRSILHTEYWNTSCILHHTHNPSYSQSIIILTIHHTHNPSYSQSIILTIHHLQIITFTASEVRVRTKPKDGSVDIECFHLQLDDMRQNARPGGEVRIVLLLLLLLRNVLLCVCTNTPCCSFL
jgi:hypothetical protein